MPRQSRLDAPDFLQYVTARGIENRDIFIDDEDRFVFLERLALILETSSAQCFAWALMPNHFHLLIRTGSASLREMMRRLMTSHAVNFNHRYNRIGHLFHNRYKSLVCEKKPYLLELTRYIHLNPLRAQLVSDMEGLDHYPWAGHCVLMGLYKNPLLIEGNKKPLTIDPESSVKEVLDHFGDKPDKARRNYRAFVEKGIAMGRRPDLMSGGMRHKGETDQNRFGEGRIDQIDHRILGSSAFVRDVLKKSGCDVEKKHLPKPSIEELVELVAKKMDLNPDLMRSGSRHGKYSKAKMLVVWLAVEEAGYSCTEVARYLNISQPAVSRARDRAILMDKQGLLGQIKPPAPLKSPRTPS